jgi:hypothetical protein
LGKLGDHHICPAFQLFKKVGEAYFGKTLHSNYSTIIKNSRVAYAMFGISIPLKVCSKALFTSIINDIFMQMDLLESHVRKFLVSKGEVWDADQSKLWSHSIMTSRWNWRMTSCQEYLERILSILVK